VLTGDFGVVVSLHVDPEHVAQSQCARQAQCGVGADAALGAHDRVDTAGRHVDRFGDPVLRDRFGYNNRALGLR
jgi:hypothetical protein